MSYPEQQPEEYWDGIDKRECVSDDDNGFESVSQIGSAHDALSCHANHHDLSTIPVGAARACTTTRVATSTAASMATNASVGGGEGG